MLVAASSTRVSIGALDGSDFPLEIPSRALMNGPSIACCESGDGYLRDRDRDRAHDCHRHDRHDHHARGPVPVSCHAPGSAGEEASMASEGWDPYTR